MKARWLLGGARDLARDLARTAVGRAPVRPIGGATLEPEDLAVADAALGDRATWRDPAALEAYESAYAAWNGSAGAWAFSAGRTALAASIAALRLGPGDEVILPAFTCVVVPNAFRLAGVNVRWADIELDTYGLDVEAFERAVGPRTRAVVVQHLFGLVARDWEAVVEGARRRGLRVIEDCAHSSGAEARGRRVGALGDVAFHSTEKSKVMCTVQGGIATTDDPDVARALAQLRAAAGHRPDATVERLLRQVHHLYDARRGLVARHWSAVKRRDALIESTLPREVERGAPDDAGCRLPAPLAALGTRQLTAVDRFAAVRRSNAARWHSWAMERGFATPLVRPDSTPTFLRYPVRVAPERKADTRWATRELGVYVGTWFLGTEHPRPEVAPGCPNAAEAVATCINLPGIP